MKLLVLFVLLLVALQIAAWNPRARSKGHRGRHYCTRPMRRNAGRLPTLLSSQECANLTFQFTVPTSSVLVLIVTSSMKNPSAEIRTRNSSNSPVRLFRRIRHGRREYRFDSPVVELVLGNLAIGAIEGIYRILSRPSFPVAMPIILQQKHDCDVNSIPSVKLNCDGTMCTVVCKEPEFIPRRKNDRLECGEVGWRHQAVTLCVPRSSLGNLCFDDEEELECGFDNEDFLKFFQREEEKAGDDRPDFSTLRPPIKIGESRMGHFSKFFQKVCLRRYDTRRYKWRCQDINPKKVKRCLRLRYMTSSCNGADIFS